jgi:hypothetical protein
MTIKYLKAGMLAIAAGVVLLSTSCEIYPNGYSSFTYSTNGYSSSVAWTAASYDAHGFPIYGYYYGRPVYGYTVSGSPIFSINLLVAGCYVPNWHPAPWYDHHHHYHYPHGCHHAPKPPKHEHGHKPHVRPDMHAPIHKNPQSVLGKPRPADKPHHAAKPVTRPSTVQRPSVQQPSKPITRPSTVQRPTVQQPSKPITRPSTVQRPTVQQPSKPTVTRPSTVTRQGSGPRRSR